MAEAVKNFEDLAVYQRARALVKDIYGLTRVAPFSRDYGLTDQIRRAAVSILSNIAEGFERGGNSELIQFLYIAKGSCGEIRAQLTIAADQQYCDQETHTRLHGDSRRISAMLSNLITYLRGSNLKGPKHVPAKIPRELQSMLAKFRSRSSSAPDDLPPPEAS